MSILVTGGAGFIGSHLIEKLLNENNRVICLDNFNSYYEPSIKFKNIENFLSDPNFRLIQGDILDKELLENILETVDVIFHEAAQAGVRISIENPLRTHTINATGTLTILEAAKNSDVKKFINASSSSVFGKVEYLP